MVLTATPYFFRSHKDPLNGALGAFLNALLLFWGCPLVCLAGPFIDLNGDLDCWHVGWVKRLHGFSLAQVLLLVQEESLFASNFKN